MATPQQPKSGDQQPRAPFEKAPPKPGDSQPVPKK
jgi:hypothetical protein